MNPHGPSAAPTWNRGYFNFDEVWGLNRLYSLVGRSCSSPVIFGNWDMEGTN